jgi:hypothetical protein
MLIQMFAVAPAFLHLIRASLDTQLRQLRICALTSPISFFFTTRYDSLHITNLTPVYQQHTPSQCPSISPSAQHHGDTNTATTLRFTPSALSTIMANTVDR